MEHLRTWSSWGPKLAFSPRFLFLLFLLCWRRNPRHPKFLSPSLPITSPSKVCWFNLLIMPEPFISFSFVSIAFTLFAKNVAISVTPTPCSNLCFTLSLECSNFRSQSSLICSKIHKCLSITCHVKNLYFFFLDTPILLILNSNITFL